MSQPPELIECASGGLAFLHRAVSPSGRALILLNAGLIHRVGPFRLHVDIAEQLTPRGVDVVRLDFPGIGDAPPSSADRVKWLRGVLNSLQELLGEREFYLGGLCSAADIAWKIPAHDPRVRGLLLLDPRAVGGFWQRVGQLHLLLRKLRRDGVTTTTTRLVAHLRALEGTPSNQLRDWGSLSQFAAGNRALASANVAIFALYTGAVTRYVTHPNQAIATFGPNSDRVRTAFWPEIDHTFFRVQDRARVVAAISDWMCR